MDICVFMGEWRGQLFSALEKTIVEVQDKEFLKKKNNRMAGSIKVGIKREHLCTLIPIKKETNQLDEKLWSSGTEQPASVFRLHSACVMEL